jgi:hypothetical protein
MFQFEFLWLSPGCEMKISYTCNSGRTPFVPPAIITIHTARTKILAIRLRAALWAVLRSLHLTKALLLPRSNGRSDLSTPKIERPLYGAAGGDKTLRPEWRGRPCRRNIGLLRAKGPRLRGKTGADARAVEGGRYRDAAISIAWGFRFPTRRRPRPSATLRTRFENTLNSLFPRKERTATGQ